MSSYLPTGSGGDADHSAALPDRAGGPDLPLRAQLELHRLVQQAVLAAG